MTSLTELRVEPRKRGDTIHRGSDIEDPNPSKRRKSDEYKYVAVERRNLSLLSGWQFSFRNKGGGLKSIERPAPENPKDWFLSELVAKHIPVNETWALTRRLWFDFLRQEMFCSPRLDAFMRIKVQIPEAKTRSELVEWMSQACGCLGWTTASFYGSVSTFDLYVARCQHVFPSDYVLGRVAAVAMYYASQMQETAADDVVKPLDRFFECCPEVAPAESFMSEQVHLIDTLQGRNPCRKTPFDFLMLMLSRLQLCAGRWGRAVSMVLLANNLLGRIFAAFHVATVLHYVHALNIYLRCSVWTAVALEHLIRIPIQQSAVMTEQLLVAVGLEHMGLQGLTTTQRQRLVSRVVGDTMLEVSSVANEEPITMDRELTPTHDWKGVLRIDEDMVTRLSHFSEPFIKTVMTAVGDGSALEKDIYRDKCSDLWLHFHPSKLIAQLTPDIKSTIILLQTKLQEWHEKQINDDTVLALLDQGEVDDGCGKLQVAGDGEGSRGSLSAGLANDEATRRKSLEACMAPVKKQL